jgi:hypothetical protein
MIEYYIGFLRLVSVEVSWLSFQHIYILKTVQKRFISMKLSLLPWNFHHLSLYRYNVILAYLMLMKIPLRLALQDTCEKRKKIHSSPCKDLPVVFVIDNRMSHTTNHRCMEKQRSSSSLQLEANTLSTKKHCSSSTARQTAYQTRYAVETLNKQSLHRRWWWDLTPQESRASPTHPTRKRTKRR